MAAVVPKAGPNAKARPLPAEILPIVSHIQSTVFTVVTSIEPRDGQNIVHFVQYETSGRIVAFSAVLRNAAVVALTRDSPVINLHLSRSPRREARNKLTIEGLRTLPTHVTLIFESNGVTLHTRIA